jgi:hypothetical protein
MKKERRCKNKAKIKTYGIYVEYCLRYHHIVKKVDCRKCGEGTDEKV